MTTPTVQDLRSAKLKLGRLRARIDNIRWLSASIALAAFMLNSALTFIPLIYLVPNFCTTTYHIYLAWQQKKLRAKLQQSTKADNMTIANLSLQALFLATGLVLTSCALAGYFMGPGLVISLAAVVVYEAAQFTNKHIRYITNKNLRKSTSPENQPHLAANQKFAVLKLTAGLILAVVGLLIILNPITAPIAAPIGFAALILPVLARAYAKSTGVFGNTASATWLHRTAAVVAVTGFVGFMLVPGLNFALVIANIALAFSSGVALRRYVSSMPSNLAPKRPIDTNLHRPLVEEQSQTDATLESTTNKLDNTVQMYRIALQKPQSIRPRTEVRFEGSTRKLRRC